MAQEAQLDSGTTTLSGTSMAAPDVAGAAALLATEGVDDPTERAFERPLDRSRTSRRARSRHGLLDIQAALQNDQPEDEPADVLTDDGRRRTPRRHLPWGSGRTRQLARDLPVGISMTRTRRQFLASGGAAGLSFLPGWLPFVGGDSDDTESTDDRSPTLAEREDQYGMTIDYPEVAPEIPTGVYRRSRPNAAVNGTVRTPRAVRRQQYQYAYYWHKLTHQQGICSTRTATSATTSRRSFGSTRTV